MNALVEKLSAGEHPVEITIRPERDIKSLKQRIDNNFVHVKFTDTKGGTEIGVRLNKELSMLDADFEAGTGRIKLVGNLTLDYCKVQCVAEIDLSTFTGKGHLVLL